MWNRRRIAGRKPEDEAGVPEPEDEAKVAEGAFDFWSAARWYRAAAERSAQSGDVDCAALQRMRSARALEKGEHWRTQSASWELLGNELGAHLAHDKLERDDRYGIEKDREDVAGFYVISDDEWTELPDQTYNGTSPLGLRHHQAQAYQWAAECALAQLQFADAARLFRRAGVAWQASKRTRQFRRAADCYYQAAVAAAQSSRIPTRLMICDKRWCPSCLRDKRSEEKCTRGANSALEKCGEGEGTDLERLQQCWDCAAAEPVAADAATAETADEDPETTRDETADEDPKTTRAETTGEHPKTRRAETADEALKTACRQFAAIQRQLAIGGARDDAIAAYRFRLAFMRSRDRRHHKLRYAQSLAGLLISRNSSSVRHLLGVLVVFYAVLVPGLWLAAGVVSPASGRHGGAFEALVFSISNVADFTPGHFKPGDAVTTLL